MTVERRDRKFKQGLFRNIHLRTDSRFVNETLPLGHLRSAPAINPFGLLRGQVDAAVAVRFAIIVMPVRAMDRDAVNIDIGCPGHTRQVIETGYSVPAGHMPRRTLEKREETACGRAGATAFALTRPTRDFRRKYRA